MQPPFKSFPRQTRSNSSTSTLPEQAFTSNMLQNSVLMQPQLGITDPQIPFPLNNSNGHAMGSPNMPPTPLLTQPNFMNAPNPLLFSQYNHLGLPHLGPMFPLNYGNLPQNASQGQIFAPNLSNMPQQLNQNMGLLNGQMCLQNVQQLLSMQMLNPTLFGNPQFGLANCNVTGQHVNQNQQNFVQQGNSCAPLKSCSSGAQQSQNSQPSAFVRSQGKFVQNGRGSVSSSNWKNVPGKNFTRNLTREPLQGFQKSQFHQMDNSKRKFMFHNGQKAKGHANGKAMKFSQANHMNQPLEKKRKTLALTYTEQEIKQWCEERRKNYPTKANINKKLSEKQSNSEVIDKEAKMRREILAKQAQLGVEVAEIPSHYLSDSEKLVRGREENVRPLNKRGRCWNKHDKRGRYNRKDQFAKKQKLADHVSSNTSSFNKRKPTLLLKLLTTDIRRDKSYLLQAFRFIAMNAFLKDWPEKPLKFPSVIVKESEAAGEVVEEKSSLTCKDGSKDSSRTSPENLVNDNSDNERGEKKNQNIQASDDDVDDDDEQMNFYVREKGIMDQENAQPEEEEGEIID